MITRTGAGVDTNGQAGVGVYAYTNTGKPHATKERRVLAFSLVVETIQLFHRKAKQTHSNLQQIRSSARIGKQAFIQYVHM